MLVDCTQACPKPLKDKYSIGGYPTLIIATPAGEPVGKASRSASALKSEFKSAIAKHAIKVNWKKGVSEGLAEAKKESKLALVFFNDPKKAASPHVEGFFYDEAINGILDKFVVVQHKVAKKCEVCKEYKVRKGPEIHLYDPITGKAFKKFRSFKSAAKLKKALLAEQQRYEKERASATP